MTPHAHKGPFLPPDDEPSPAENLLLAAVVLVMFCAAFYSLIVGLATA